MANEEKSSEAVTITDTVNMCENISSFYLEEKFSDVTLVLDGQQIYAHKVILAARSKYFESLLGPTQNEIIIRDVSSKTFRKLLKYIYTGSVTLLPSETELIFDVMQLASRYQLRTLEIAISEKISSLIDVDNVFEILNKANDCEMEGLRNVCHEFMDANSMNILSNDKLNSLTQKSMIKLLERDSFLAPEIEIFKSVAKWCTINKDDGNLVMQCIRLSSLTNEEILSIVYPSKLVDEKKLLAIMAEKIDGKRKPPNARVVLIKDENLATPRYGAEVICGKSTNFLLSGHRDVPQCAYHFLNDEGGITVKLGAPAYVNHIHMRLFDIKKRCYSYYVEVSLNQKNWRRVVDYNRYDCRSYQNLYFDQVLVRYIRIVGTSFVNKVFHLAFFEIYLKTDTPTINRDGIIYPIENVATTDKGAVVNEGNPGDKIGTLSNVFASCATISSAIIIQLAQPYMVSSIRFLLPSDPMFKYKYRIETSVDKCCWQIAVDYGHHSYASWQYVEFKERPVVYIRLTGNGSNNAYSVLCSNVQAQTVVFRCTSLECPSSSTQKSLKD